MFWQIYFFFSYSLDQVLLNLPFVKCFVNLSVASLSATPAPCVAPCDAVTTPAPCVAPCDAVTTPALQLTPYDASCHISSKLNII